MVSAMTLKVFADIYTIPTADQRQMFEEAEDWIDNLPEGLQDRISDAVNHAKHGFFSEIEYLRHVSDTTEKSKYKVEVKNITGNGNPGMRLYKAQDTGKKPLLVYFHGGGWSVGSIDTTDKFCRAVASDGNVNIISIEYPLAPENPYPSALIACVEATKGIISHTAELGIEVSGFSLGGDGAGANLALATFEALPSDSHIASLVMYYPLLTTTGSLDPANKKEYGRGFGFDSRVWEAFTDAYKGEEIKLTKPLPPTLLISAGRDIIIRSERDFASANGEVTYVEFEDAIHGFITDGHQPTAFKKAVALTQAFLQNPHMPDHPYKER